MNIPHSFDFLHTIMMISAAIGFFTALRVLYFGDWRKLTLKYAGCVISTTSLFLITIIFIFGMQQQAHDTLQLCYSALSISLALFYVAFGRDAIKLKNGDRRKDVGKRFEGTDYQYAGLAKESRYLPFASLHQRSRRR